jgi:hypothetical protein
MLYLLRPFKLKRIIGFCDLYIYNLERLLMSVNGRILLSKNVTGGYRGAGGA